MENYAEVFIPNSRRIELTSCVNGRRCIATVALPYGSPPDAGYGVFYVLDAYWYFASAIEAVRSYGNAEGVAVVGIGYPSDPAWINAVLERHAPLPASLSDVPKMLAASALERCYDFTLPASEEVLADQSVPGLFNPKTSDVGGLEEFLRMIEMEMKPRIAAIIPIDDSNQTLFGHSLGGLAVVHALFKNPGSFRTFVASSPSIWWNRRSVLDGEAAFAEAVSKGRAEPRVLITVGSEEERVPECHPGLAVDRLKLKSVVGKSQMIANACDLATRLKNLKGSGAFEVEDCAVFHKVGHALAPWSALARAVAFATVRRQRA